MINFLQKKVIGKIKWNKSCTSRSSIYIIKLHHQQLHRYTKQNIFVYRKEYTHRPYMYKTKKIKIKNDKTTINLRVQVIKKRYKIIRSHNIKY